MHGNLQYDSPALEMQAWLLSGPLESRAAIIVHEWDFNFRAWEKINLPKYNYYGFSRTRAQELRQKLISRESQKSPIVSNKTRNPKATQKTRMACQAHRKHLGW